MKSVVALSFVFFGMTCGVQCREPISASVQGSVRDARDGASLARVEVVLEGTPYRGITNPEGQFEINDIRPGDYLLSISTVGYREELVSASLATGEIKELDVALTPGNLNQRTTIQVKADRASATLVPSPSEFSLSGQDAKALPSALADDPLRAVQALPGVTSDDDFTSRFSLRAADPGRIGLYMDGVLLHEPFFMVENEGGAPAVTVLNADLLDNTDLQPGVFPSRYASSTAAVVDMQSREGSQTRPSFSISAGATNASILGEGPVGKNQAGDWLFSVRKSYLQYMVDLTSPGFSPYVFGMFDEQGRVAYNLGNRNKVSLSLVDGYSGFKRTNDLAGLADYELKLSNYHFSLANLGWNFTPSANFLATNHLAWMREAIAERYKVGVDYERGQYGEWVWNSDATWMWHANQTLNFGWSMRRIRDDGQSGAWQYTGLPYGILEINPYRGTAVRMGGYGEQVWKAAKGRIALATGVRWDKYGLDDIQTVLPQATLALRPWQSTRLSFGFGQYAQEPDPAWAFSPLGGRRLLPERANSFEAALDQQVGEHTRLQVEFYDRQDRDILFRSWFEPRLIGGSIFIPPLNPPISNPLSGYARGMEISLERHNVGRLSGWVSYSAGFSRLDDREAAISFPSDEDQRHSVNIFLGYRIRPTVTLGIRSVYGSGLPLPGFYRQQDGRYYLSAMRNGVYGKAYDRTDFRMDKQWSLDRWKLTFYAEVVNTFDRANQRFDNLNGFSPTTGEANLQFTTMLPLLPEAGLSFQF